MRRGSATPLPEEVAHSARMLGTSQRDSREESRRLPTQTRADQPLPLVSSDADYATERGLLQTADSALHRSLASGNLNETLVR